MERERLLTSTPSRERAWTKWYDMGADRLELPKCTIYEFLKENSAKNLDRPAIVYHGTRISYRSFLAQIDRYADCFAALGVKPGEYVAFITINLPESLASFYALNKIGAIPVLVEPRMGAERIRRFVEMVEAKTLLVLDIAFPKVKNLIPELKIEHVILQSAEDSLPKLKGLARKLTARKPEIPLDDVVISTRQFEGLYGKAHAEEAPYVPGSVCAISQTGGTTGVPKGVQLTNDGLNTVALNLRESWVGHSGMNRFLNIMPMFTSYGIVCGVHSSLNLSLETILVPDFTPDKFARLIKKYRPGGTIAVPAFYEKLLEAPELKNADLSNLVFVVSGGDHMNAQLEEKLNAFLKAHGARYPIAQGYGLSETSAAITFTFGSVYRTASVGVPMLTSTLGVFRPGTTEELGYGETGEICVTGNTLMKGYYKNQAETDNVLKTHPDGTVWVHSGDLGHLDEDGFLFFDGRIKFVIPRFDGHKNYPAQIEEVVLRHPEVADCAVIAAKDREHSQGMYPLVIAVAGETDKTESELRSSILKLCSDVLEERGQPCGVVFVEAIPKTLVGKNDVTALSKQYGEYDYLHPGVS